MKKLKILIVLALLLSITIAILSLCETKVNSQIDTYVYNLPYEPGTHHKIVQGYGGLFTHSFKAALDFEMPIGTPVLAAREGELYSFKENSKQGGPFNFYSSKANYIIIKHTDGSYGCYWHLKEKGVVVEKGWVKKGQLIGYSGNTGFTLRPHLHFAVKRFLNYKMSSYLKTKFNTPQGVKLLIRGNSY